jgi:hypothetical protein
MSALPLHIWTFFLAFRDFDWVAARTNSWDAIGVVAYGLLFALIESCLVFFTATLLGFFVSTLWGEKKRVALISILIIILSLWSIFDQSYFLRQATPPAWLIGLAFQTERPLVLLYILAFVAVSISIVIPTYFILRSEKALEVIREGMERLSLLMSLYLFFDAAAVVILMMRNL